MSGISHPMVRRSGKSIVAEVASDKGDSNAPNTKPRSIVGSEDYTLLESDAERTPVSSAAEKTESSEEEPAGATVSPSDLLLIFQSSKSLVSPQSELGTPGGGLGQRTLFG